MGFYKKVRSAFGRLNSHGREPKTANAIGPNILSPGKDAVVEQVPLSNPIIGTFAHGIYSLLFLHGLTGHRDGTWTAAKEKDPWPKSLLSADIPNARIITYGYDADVVHWTRPAGQNTVREHARNLVNDFVILRKSTQTTGRPILFVVHSLGGLVCQDALLICNNPNEEDQRDILSSTRGIAFLGTPHAGSDFEAFGTAVANIVSLSIIKKPNKELLKVLNKHSAILANIKNDFLTLVRTRTESRQPAIKLHAFTEELPVAFLGHRVVTPDSALIPGYNSSGIPANHMDMTKFGARTNRGYERVSGILKIWIGDLNHPEDFSYQRNKNPNPAYYSSTALQSSAEIMNDPNLGDKKYYRYPTKTGFRVKRAKLLAEIERKMQENTSEGGPRVIILHGMGGQGKTQLAIEVCRQADMKRQFLAVFWLDASAEERLKEGFDSLFDVVRAPEQTFESSNSRITFVRNRIAMWNRDWLLVFDNYDDPAGFRNVADYIPQSAHGTILFTTRHANLERLGTVIPVRPMTPEEALQLFYNRAGGKADSHIFEGQEEYASKIVERLGYLPLAIDQAGAYIQRRLEFPLSQFLDEYEQRKSVIWMKVPAVWEYKGVVYTTWELSFQLIDRHDRERAEKASVLTMLSFLDFRNISREIFNVPRPGEEKRAKESEPDWVQLLLTKDGDWDLIKLDDLFYDFKDLSLVQISAGSGRGTFRLSLHPLVSEWVKFRADIETRQQCLLQAIRVVNACLQALRNNKTSWLSTEAQHQVFLHQSACAENLERLRQDDPEFSADIVQWRPLSSTIRETRRVTEEVKKTTINLAAELSASTKISHQVQQLRDDKNRQFYLAILDWISPIQFEFTHLDVLARRHEGTGQWLIEHEVFRNWLSGSNNTLWCTGPPIRFGATSLRKSCFVSQQQLARVSKVGRGIVPQAAMTFAPSIYLLKRFLRTNYGVFLRSIVIEHLRKFEGVQPHRIITLFVYCNYKDANSQTTANHIASLLQQAVYQTLHQVDELPDSLMEMHADHSNRRTRPGMSQLASVLSQALKRFSKTNIVIDALDECSDESGVRLLEVLEMLRHRENSINIFITSRPSLDASSSPTLQTAARLSIAATDADIAHFIAASLHDQRRLRRILSQNPSANAEIIARIVQLSNGMFLTAKLFIDHLGRQQTMAGIHRALDTFPSSVDDLFDSVIGRIRAQNSGDTSLALRVLAWLISARRPLTIREVVHALSFNLGDEHLDPNSLIYAHIIPSVCAGLVELDEDADGIFLVHFAVQDYLMRRRSGLFPDAHADITATCLGYLSVTFPVGRPREQILQFPFLAYAARYWFIHASIDERPDTIIPFLENDKSRTFWIDVWNYVHATIETEPVVHDQQRIDAVNVARTPLEIAEALGLDKTGTAIRGNCGTKETAFPIGPRRSQTV